MYRREEGGRVEKGKLYVRYDKNEGYSYRLPDETMYTDLSATSDYDAEYAAETIAAGEGWKEER